jgi:hypothetical protein
MLSVLANRTYRHLLSAQIIALVGTGLATLALGLLAYDIAGANAGAVLGTALAIKHEHPDLPENHPHKLQHATSQSGHAHDYLIDDLHATWPR